MDNARIGRKWEKIALPILIFLAIAVIAAIIILLILPKQNKSSDNSSVIADESASSLDVTITGDNPEQIEYRRLNYLVTSLGSRNNTEEDQSDKTIENDIKNFISTATEKYGKDTPQEAEANILLANYYFTIGKNNLGFNQLYRSINNSQDITSKVYYYIAIYNQYLKLEDIDGQIAALKELLSIPEGEVYLYDEDWSSLRSDYATRLEQISANEEANND